MSLLILFQGGPAASMAPPPQQMGSSAGGVAADYRKEARMMRDYRQSLADEDAVIAFIISRLS